MLCPPRIHRPAGSIGVSPPKKKHPSVEHPPYQPTQLDVYHVPISVGSTPCFIMFKQLFVQQASSLVSLERRKHLAVETNLTNLGSHYRLCTGGKYGWREKEQTQNKDRSKAQTQDAGVGGGAKRALGPPGTAESTTTGLNSENWGISKSSKTMARENPALKIGFNFASREGLHNAAFAQPTA